MKTIVLLGGFFALVLLAVLSSGALRGLFAALSVVAALVGTLAAFIYIPGFDLFGRLPWRGPRTRRAIAITFDDGPNDPHTATILDTLKRHGARATFFLLGRSVDRHPELARRVAAEGHAVGSHTQNHTKLHFESPATIRAEVAAGRAALARERVRDDGIFRPPHGLKSPFLPRILKEEGVRAVAWTDGVWDTDNPGVDVIVSRALKWLRPGEILLLHDGKAGLDRSQTAAALDGILEACKARGLECVTIPDLLGWETRR